MKRSLSLLAFSLFAVVARAEEPPPVTWETDLAKARAQAAEKGRPLLVVFR